MMFIQHSQTGAVEAAGARGGSWTGLNDALHAN